MPVGLEINFVPSQPANFQCGDFFEPHNNKSLRYLVERLDTIVSSEDRHPVNDRCA